MFILKFCEENGLAVLDFEIWPFQNRHIWNQKALYMSMASDKKCTFWANFALRKRKKMA